MPTAQKIKTLSYKVSHKQEFVESVASKLLGREISFQVVPEDRTFDLSPTLRCRLGETAYACFFYLDKFKSVSSSDLDLVTNDIAQNYPLESDDPVSTIIFAVTDTNLFSVSCNGLTSSVAFKSKSELLSKMDRSELAEEVRRLVKEIAPSPESSQIAAEFANVLDIGSYEGLNKFLSKDLGWGASVSIPKSVSLISDIELTLYKPRTETRDHILVMHWPHSVRGVTGPRAAHSLAKRIADIMDHQDKPIALALVYGEKDAVMMAPGESWDLRVQFHRSRLREPGWVRNCSMLLRNSELPINYDRKRIDQQQLLQSRELDARFNALCADFRLCLVKDLISGYKPVISECLNFLRGPNDVPVKVSNIEDILITDRARQSLFISAVDSIVLRTIVRRFIEVYHANPFDIAYDTLLEKFGESFDTPREDVGRLSDGKKARFLKSQRIRPGHEQDLKKAFRDLGNKYRDRYGGDMHFSRIALAVDYLEDQLTAKYLAELLDITNAKRYKFRYEDLRPDALEDYYQRTIETSVQLTLKNGILAPEVSESKSARKELGAFFTPAEASAFTVKLSMAKWLDEKSKEIDEHINAATWDKATTAILSFVNIRVLDPTVGGASFLKQAFKEFTRVERATKLRSWMQALLPSKQEEILKKFPWCRKDFSFHDFEEHVMKNCLYGVDIDFKGLTIGAYTLTLEALTYMEGSEKFPGLLNRTLKQGNAFINWLEPGEWKSIDPKVVKNLLSLRQKAVTASPHLLAPLLEEESMVRNEILEKYKLKRASEWGFNPSPLQPFCWELEFPEAFYDAEGKPLDEPGFSIVVGNPPWETLKGTEPDFFECIDDKWPKGKNAKKVQSARKATLLKSKDIKAQYDRYFEKIDLYSRMLDCSSQYKCIEPKYEAGGARGGNGDPNTYKLACERFLNMVGSNGCFGFIVPEGISADKGNRDLRLLLIEKGITDIVGFSKKNQVFVGVNQAFAVIAGGTCRKSANVRYTSTHTDTASAVEVHSKTPPVGIAIMQSLPMSTMPFIALNSGEDVNLFQKFVKAGTSGFKIKGYRELDTTMDMDLSENGPLTRGYAIIKGENTGRFFPPNKGELSYGLNATEYRRRHPTRAKFLEKERVAWHKISGTSDKRRMVASIIPPRMACFDSMNVVDPESLHGLPMHFVTSVLNSFCYEWLVRLVSKNNNINIFVVEGLPLPKFSAKNSNCSAVIEFSKQLHIQTKDSGKRSEIEAKLEAHVAHIYGLSNNEFEHLLAAFPKVEESYKDLVLSYFKSQSTIKDVA